MIRVADVISAAGLINGGFYKYFKSKEDLLGEALGVATREIAEDLARPTDGVRRRKGLQTGIRVYLREQQLR